MNLIPILRKRWLSLPWPKSTKRRLLRKKFNDLVKAYEGRGYHNLLHIYECLLEFDKIKQFLKDPFAVEIEIWYHDYIQDPKCENFIPPEIWSACKAETDLTELGCPIEFVSTVLIDIPATQHRGLETGDRAYLVDIDLAIFGKPRKRVDEYEEGIWAEYHWLRDDDSAHKTRAKILGKFLDKKYRKHVYGTRYFRKKYEKRARAALRRLIEKNSK